MSAPARCSDCGCVQLARIRRPQTPPASVCLCTGSALIGLAGGYLSVVDVKLWIPDISGGRGWIAIALVIFARWQPWRALLGALLFGCIEAVIPRIAAAGIQVPQYFLLMTPYL